ncbi:unnamed protein product [Rotaria magnacalcarata]
MSSSTNEINKQNVPVSLPLNQLSPVSDRDHLTVKNFCILNSLVMAYTFTSICFLYKAIQDLIVVGNASYSDWCGYIVCNTCLTVMLIPWNIKFLTKSIAKFTAILKAVWSSCCEQYHLITTKIAYLNGERFIKYKSTYRSSTDLTEQKITIV